MIGYKHLRITLFQCYQPRIITIAHSPTPQPHGTACGNDCRREDTLSLKPPDSLRNWDAQVFMRKLRRISNAKTYNQNPIPARTAETGTILLHACRVECPIQREVHASPFITYVDWKYLYGSTNTCFCTRSQKTVSIETIEILNNIRMPMKCVLRKTFP